MKKIIESIKLICLIIITISFVIITINLSKTKNNYDVNNDGKVDSLDLLLIKKYLLAEDKKQ